MSLTIGRLRRLVLVDLGRIDVDVNNRSGLAELLDFAGHAIVEAHAEREQQIGAGRNLHHRFVGTFALLEFAVHRPVRVSRAVHAEPAQRKRMRFRETRRSP